MVKVQEFLTNQQKRLLVQLIEKYPTDTDEDVRIEEVVNRFLDETYDQAKKLSQTIYERKQPVILFIGFEKCPICKRGRLEIEELKRLHAEVEIFIIDYYKDSSGLLYHMIEDSDNGGQLPMIALVQDGYLEQVWIGEAVDVEELETFLVKTDP